MKVSPILLLGILFTLSAFAQGTVNFVNTANTFIYTNSQSFPPPGQLPNQVGLMTGDGQYTIGLYVAPAGTTDPNSFTLMGPTTFSHGGIGSGWFNGGFVRIADNTGDPIAFQVRAWSTFAGLTYDQALSSCCGAYVGSSAIGAVTPAMGLTPPARLFGVDPTQIGFTLVPIGFDPSASPVPEPSSAWLLLIGAALGFGAFRHSVHRR
jgi:hypothetical protein